MPRIIFLYFLVNFLGIADSHNFCDITTENEENLLKQQLFCNGYDSEVRPVKNHETKTIVGVRMIVKSFEFNDVNSHLLINSWIITSWNDEYLVWDPTQHADIKSLDVAANLFWRPQVAMYTDAAFMGDSSCYPMDCMVQYFGKVSCIEPCSHIGICEADYTQWPFDYQNCSFSFGTWMSQGNEIDFSSNKTSISADKVEKNSGWKLASFNSAKSVTIFFHKKQGLVTFPKINFYFNIERLPGAEAAFVFCPAIIFIVVNFIILLMNPKIGDRFLLIGLNIISHFLFMVQLTFYVPYNAEGTPAVYLYYRDSLLITTLLLIESIIISSINYFEITPPNWIENLTQRVQGMRSGLAARRSNSIKIEDESQEETQEEKDGETQEISLSIPSESEETPAPKMPEPKEKFKIFAKVFDRIMLVIILLLYLIKAYGLIPKAEAEDSSFYLEEITD